MLTAHTQPILSNYFSPLKGIQDDRSEKTAFFSGLKQNFKNTWKKIQHDGHEESLQGADQTDGGRIETERNVLVDRIPPGKGELSEDVNSVDLTKG